MALDDTPSHLLRELQEVDPLICSHCGAEMKLIALIDDQSVIEKILRHLKLWPEQTAPACLSRAPPPDGGVRERPRLRGVTGLLRTGAEWGWIAFAVNMSIRLVEECERLIQEFSQSNPSFERNLATRLDELLKDRKEGAK